MVDSGEAWCTHGWGVCESEDIFHLIQKYVRSAHMSDMWMVSDIEVVEWWTGVRLFISGSREVKTIEKELKEAKVYSTACTRDS